MKLVMETGDGALVASEADAMYKAIRSVPELGRVLASHDVVSDFDKKKLLQSSLGGRISRELSRFISLVLSQGRASLLPDMLRSFVDMYRKEVGLRRASLVCATEPSVHLLQQLRTIVKRKTGDDVVIDVTVDPSIIGGFIFDIDSQLLDASVQHQLELVRKEFVVNNRRLS